MLPLQQLRLKKIWKKKDLKERYYRCKLEIAEEMLQLKRRKVESFEKIGSALDTIVDIMLQN
jgi:hypothetical protein